MFYVHVIFSPVNAKLGVYHGYQCVFRISHLITKGGPKQQLTLCYFILQHNQYTPTLQKLQKTWGDITPKMGALHPTIHSLQWSEAPKE